jgi:5S rRNA maturation endonuclease (ribonuclease M5)
MFSPLTAEDRVAAPAVANDATDKSALWPVPSDAPPMNFKHPKHGAPSHAWPYHDAAGALLGYICRFDFKAEDGSPAKSYLPICFCVMADGTRAWRSKGFPIPRPLYNLHHLAARPDAPVIICEGEKTADAAAIVFPDHVATTPPHGAQSPHLADWSALAGRHVVLSPDYDEPGEKFAKKVTELLAEVGVVSIKRLTADMFKDDPFDGYDLADALAEGLTPDHMADALGRVAPATAKPAYEWPFRLSAKGVERRVDKQDRETGAIESTWVWFCSWLDVAALSRTSAAEEWGRYLQLRDSDGNVKGWSMPMRLLSGDGTELRSHLLSLGLILAPGRNAREHLAEYLSTARPTKRLRAVSQVGWASTDGFVLPGATFKKGH